MSLCPPISRRSYQSGFTLIELMVSITLVAAISTGMLMSMRTGLLTLDRTQVRLDANRRSLALDQLLRGQLGGAIPALGQCQGVQQPFFRGNRTEMLMVSSFSRAAGARGFPVVVEYAIVPNRDGTSRLVVNETPFAGPMSTQQICRPMGGVTPPTDPAVLAQRTANWFVLADRLAVAGFAYQERDALSGLGGKWGPAWNFPDLPMGLRVEMALADPAAASIPTGTVTVPLHITHISWENYDDIP